MKSPHRRKARGELASNTARKLIALTKYGALTVIANVFGSIFWFAEQRRWSLADRIYDERNVQ